jgi:coenzyme PQQ biosynthesis protein PqqD
MCDPAWDRIVFGNRLDDGQQRGIAMVMLTDRPCPSHPALAWRQVGDEVVLVDPTQADTIVRVFNDVAGAIWTLIDGQRDIAAIVCQVAGEFDAPTTEIENDVLAFIDELVGKGLLTL